MNYQLIKDSYNIHLIKTKKFKTLLLKIVFTGKFEKSEITKRNLLVDNLCFSCEKCPTARKMSIIKQDLYGLDVYASNKRTGNYFITEFNLSMLNPKYTEEDMLNLSFDFFYNVLFKPNVTNNKFNEEMFELTKEHARDEIKSIKENPTLYANIKLKQSLGDFPFSYHMEGYLEDLEEITSSSLYSYYKEFLINNNIDIFLIGDYDEKAINIINDKFKFNNKNKEINDFYIEYKNNKKDIVFLEENSKFKQTYLTIACSLEKLTVKEKKYVSAIYNVIFGNGPDSKLFKNVREKKSLAYSISSSFRRTDDLLVINAGTNVDNYQDMIDSIKKEMKDMINGKFTNLDLENAKNLYISVVNELFEYESSISEYYYNLLYLDLDKIEEEITNINSITKEDVINLAKKINIDTIYLLKEEEYEKNTD